MLLLRRLVLLLLPLFHLLLPTYYFASFMKALLALDNTFVF
jgi:hypothetical protein